MGQVSYSSIQMSYNTGCIVLTNPASLHFNSAASHTHPRWPVWVSLHFCKNQISSLVFPRPWASHFNGTPGLYLNLVIFLLVPYTEGNDRPSMF